MLEAVPSSKGKDYLELGYRLMGTKGEEAVRRSLRQDGIKPTAAYLFGVIARLAHGGRITPQVAEQYYASLDLTPEERAEFEGYIANEQKFS